MRLFFYFVSIVAGLQLKSQIPYLHDRVYTANQVSNTISVIDPSTNKLLGEIKLGKPYPDVLSPLYRGQVLVHGLRYSSKGKMLVVVSIGSNAVTFISTEDNRVLKTIYVGRSPHEPTFTPDEKQVWVSVRGEAYISVIDAHTMVELRRVAVADGPGMVAFTKDGKEAYVCSSFTPELDIVSTSTYRITKRIPVTSPFSPNIFTSPDGKWIALTHKDVGKVTVVNTATKAIQKVIVTGPITNHVTFTNVQKKLLMIVTSGAENKIRMFDVYADFRQTFTIPVDALPHGLWASADGKQLYIGLEYGDEVQRIDLGTMEVTHSIQIGQSPQALVYADNAVSGGAGSMEGLTPLHDTNSVQLFILNSTNGDSIAHGRIAVRTVGLSDLVEQSFSGLQPNTSYTLALSGSVAAPFEAGYAINSFSTDGQGKYLGQSTGMINTLDGKTGSTVYKSLILLDTHAKSIVLAGIPYRR